MQSSRRAHCQCQVVFLDKIYHLHLLKQIGQLAKVAAIEIYVVFYWCNYEEEGEGEKERQPRQT